VDERYNRTANEIMFAKIVSGLVEDRIFDCEENQIKEEDIFKILMRVNFEDQFGFILNSEQIDYVSKNLFIAITKKENLLKKYGLKGLIHRLIIESSISKDEKN